MAAPPPRPPWPIRPGRLEATARTSRTLTRRITRRQRLCTARCCRGPELSRGSVACSRRPRSAHSSRQPGRSSGTTSSTALSPRSREQSRRSRRTLVERPRPAATCASGSPPPSAKAPTAKQNPDRPDMSGSVLRRLPRASRRKSSEERGSSHATQHSPFWLVDPCRTRHSPPHVEWSARTDERLRLRRAALGCGGRGANRQPARTRAPRCPDVIHIQIRLSARNSRCSSMPPCAR